MVSDFSIARVDERAYHWALERARQVSDLVADMTSMPHEIVDKVSAIGGEFYLTDDWRSGYAITAAGELIGLFSLVSGRGSALVSEAVADGAYHLDCFDGYLPTLYARFGFREWRRDPNWVDGGPDVVFMRRV